ncbi:MAG TPA: hypothetical protein G4O12_09185, partial [Dehalococcoidia bacterium]|nr:hypothetical protein [Dehalococcoidia bacterium]
ALPIVLVLMLVGGLLIAPSLSYATTSINAGRVVEKNVNGLYAADAGVEYALWCIEADSKIPKELPENVNQLEVKIKTHEEKKGPYTIYYGELTETGDKYDYLDVGGEMVWDGVEEAYQYTITVTWQPEQGTQPIKLEEIGVRLPVGYSYQPGSAEGFFGGELFSTDEPDFEEQDGAGAYMVGWSFKHPPRPEVTEDWPIGTQTFYVTGVGELEGDYACVEAQDKDIGKVGETVGEMYTIEAEAKVPEKHGEKIIKVEACVLREEVEVVIHIVSWQVTIK